MNVLTCLESKIRRIKADRIAQSMMVRIPESSGHPNQC